MRGASARRIKMTAHNSRVYLVVDCTPRQCSGNLRQLYASEPVAIDTHTLDQLGIDPEFELLEEIAELVTIDEIDGRRTVSCRLALGIGREGASRDHQPLVA